MAARVYIAWCKHEKEFGRSLEAQIYTAKRCRGWNGLRLTSNLIVEINSSKCFLRNVWSPYIAKYRRLKENIQRRATKFILNYPSCDGTYKERLVTLDLLPLEFRREISIYILLLKHRTGQLVVYLSTLVNNFTHIFTVQYPQISWRKLSWTVWRRIKTTTVTRIP